MKNDGKKQRIIFKYLDVFNLYGWAVTQILPIGSFKWVPEKKNSMPIS